jgi:hypothetical protein
MTDLSPAARAIHLSMTEQHPITPPSELVRQWLEELYGGPVSVISPFDQRVLIAVAQWGADQELEACLRYAGDNGLSLSRMRATRRPKSPSLKEQSIALLDLIQGNKDSWQLEDLDVVRRALEALPE